MNRPLASLPFPPPHATTLKLAKAIQAAGGRALLVGGWVRDALLGKTLSKDLDIEVFGLEAKPLRNVLEGFGRVHLVGRQFGVYKLNLKGAEYDVSIPRRERKSGSGHRGFDVETDPSMTFEQAAYRRDFTMNAMGYDPLTEELMDPYGGQAHLQAGVLAHVGPAFGEDPLRTLRAMQLAARFHLTIAPETLAICREQDLTELPSERLWEEFRKLLLKARQPGLGWVYAPALGVLRLFPEWEALEPGPMEADERTLKGSLHWKLACSALDAAGEVDPPPSHLAENEAMVRQTAALLLFLDAHPQPASAEVPGVVGPKITKVDARWEGRTPQARQFLARLTSEIQLTRQVLALLQAQRDIPAASILAEPTQQALATVRRLALVAPLPQLVWLEQVHFEAWRQVAPPAQATPRAPLLQSLAQQAGVWQAPPEPLVTGKDLMALGHRPGKEMGDLLQAMFEHQLDGELTTAPAALEWIKNYRPTP